MVGRQTQSYDLPAEAAFPEEVIQDKRAVWIISPPSPAPRPSPRRTATTMRAAKVSSQPTPIREGTVTGNREVELAGRVDLRSYLALPALSAGRLVGVCELVNFARPERIEGYSEIVADVLVPAGAAIDIALLHEEARVRSAELDGLRLNLEEFTRSVSHDLRTPLTIIRGQAQLAQRALAMDRKDSVAQSLDTIVRTSIRMNDMIEDLVDTSRIEAGKLDLLRERLDLPDFAAALGDRLAGSLDVSRIRIVTPPKPLPSVWADPDRLERILVILLTNSLRYSEGEVTVGFERRDGEVVTSIADRGTGIPREELPHIFKRAYRAKGAEHTGGLGLGLYIARMLVEGHGGKIWAESRPDKGSTFYFSLPVAGGQ